MESSDGSGGKTHQNLLPTSIGPLSLAEVAGIAIELQELVGAQLQDCLQTETEVGLAIYSGGSVRWLWFDLNPRRPWVVRIQGKPPVRKKVARPLTLFLKSRFVGRRLESVTADVARGRILVFKFHRTSTEVEVDLPEIEVRLFPNAQNVIARDGEKSVAENKPKDVPPSKAPLGSSATEPEASRSWTELEELWRSQRRPQAKSETEASSGAKSQATKDQNIQTEEQRLEKEWARAIEKKEKALVRMREELEAKLSPIHREVGEWLKTNGTLEVPAEYREHVDLDEGLAWNIQRSFHRAKENERKAEGTRARLELVAGELETLRKKGPQAFARANQNKPSAKDDLLNKADARGRRLNLADNLIAYIGKSAADNLALLRKAQPFDYWLHLRDLPGSHAIVRRPRQRPVTDAEFAEAGRWVVEQSLGKRAAELKGERYDLLIVECRFVRPIKGDKLGRVNYVNDRVLTLRF